MGGKETMRVGKDEKADMTYLSVFLFSTFLFLFFSRRRVYVGCHDGRLYCFNAGSFSHDEDFANIGILWNFKAGAPVFSSPCVDYATGVVYFGCCDKSVYAVSRDGQLVSQIPSE